jgi:hypothetical protein
MSGPFDAAISPESVRSLYDSGLPCREVGKRYGISEDAVLRYMRKHGISRRLVGQYPHVGRPGPLSGTWAGGRYVDGDGYVVLWAGPRKRIYEHKQVAEKALGRKLKKNERVHHINGKRDDNRNSNLLICSTGYHLNLHLKMKRLGIDPATLEAT